MRPPSTFSALNLRLLWLTEPFPTIALIVLCILSLPFFSAGGSVTLAKSNAKALLTGKPIKNADLKGIASIPLQVLRSSRNKGCPLKRTPLQPRPNFITSRKRNIARLQMCLPLQCCNLDGCSLCFFGKLPIPLTAFLNRLNIQRFLRLVQHTLGDTHRLRFLQQCLLRIFAL